MKRIERFVLFVVVVSTVFVNPVAGKSSIKSLQGKAVVEKTLRENAIWGKRIDVDEQKYMVFRRAFVMSEVNKKIELNIFADSRYILWINGRYVMRGPCRFNPLRPEYDRLNVSSFLHRGKNSVAVLVHYYGNCVNGRIMKCEPAFTMCMCEGIGSRIILKTDSKWKYSDKCCYQPAPGSWNTVIDHIDGRIDGGEWIQPAFDDHQWRGAQTIDMSKFGVFKANELSLPREQKLELRHLPDGKRLEECLPITLKKGEEMIIDDGKMTLAYTKMKIEATANSVLSLKYALRYQDGKTFEEFGNGNQYIARSGKQEFMTTDQWGCHYMVVRCDSGTVKINGLEMVERLFPYKRLGDFVCSDHFLNELWEMSVNTIQATSDDAYGTDARERNEWIQDGIKASFPCSQVAFARPDESGKSEIRLLKNMIRHAALSQLADGRIRATFPTDRGEEDCHYFIDDYACQWFGALHTYLNMSGDMAFAREVWPCLKSQIEWFEKQKQADGLYLLREYTSFDNPFAYTTCEGATVNAFYYKALKDASAIAKMLGENEQRKKFDEIRKILFENYNRILWDAKLQAYNSAFWKDSLYAPTMHAQLIALQSGIVPCDRMSSVRDLLWKYYRNPSMTHCCTNNDVKKMVDNHCGIGMPIVYYWLFCELYKTDTEQKDEEALNEMRRRWKYMVSCQKDIGTLSESFVNSPSERPSQSCHNYGVIPAYYLSSYVLGVRCEKAIDTREIVIEPRLGDLKFAAGKVVTMYGVVKISWNKDEAGHVVSFSFTLPKGITAVLRLPSTKYHLSHANEQTIEREGRWTVLKNIKGNCSGNFYLK